MFEKLKELKWYIVSIVSVFLAGFAVYQWTDNHLVFASELKPVLEGIQSSQVKQNKLIEKNSDGQDLHTFQQRLNELDDRVWKYTQRYASDPTKMPAETKEMIHKWEIEMKDIETKIKILLEKAEK